MLKSVLRFLLIFLLLTVFAVPLASNFALAQSSQMEMNTNPDVPNNLHTYTQNVAIEVLSSAVCLLAGVDPVDPTKQCLGIDQHTHKIGYIQSGGGALGGMGQLIGMTFNIPVHTSDYFKDMASNFGITKHAYAAVGTGYGFRSISSLEHAWSAFLSVVYMIFVLAFVLIGLAIMLRVKIDPRTVMSIQNQIPKIIVGLVLVTFSFAIAGFLIDVMYSSIYLMSNVAAKADSSINDVQTGVVTSTNPFQAVAIATGGSGDLGAGTKALANIAWQPARTVGNFIQPVLDNPPGRILSGIIGGYIGLQIGKLANKLPLDKISGAIGGIIGVFFGPEGVPVGVIGGEAIGKVITSVTTVLGVGIGVAKGPDIFALVISIIAFLVISIALIFALFRLWFQLISAYVFILIDIVFAPFWIALGMFPGSQMTFGLWLRDLIANLAAFPTAIVMFYLGRIFINSFGLPTPDPTVAKFVPPMITNPNSPHALGSIIGLGIILLTPNALNMTKAALKAPKFDTRPIAQAIGVGTGAPGGISKSALNYSSQLYYLGRVPGVQGIPFIGKLAYKAAHGTEGGHTPPPGAAGH